MPGKAAIRVGAFVDWNSQLRAADALGISSEEERARKALRRLGATVSRTLVQEAPLERFRLELRLYAGWTKGFTRSDYFRALVGIREGFDLDAMFPSARVNVSAEIGFGDRLIDCGPDRLNAGLGIHLPNTLRQQEGGGRLQQKMVDTALASDLLSWVRGAPEAWALVISTDDDLVPPVLVAEAWLQDAPGRVLLIRPGERRGDRFLPLQGLVRQ